MAQARQFVAACRAEIGNGPSKYNTGGLPWCAIFVNRMLEQVGDTRQGTAAAASFSSFGTLHRAGDGYSPKPGDLVIVKLSSDKSWAQHVAVCEEFAGETIKTINGNGTGNVVTESLRKYNSDITIVEMSWNGETSEDNDSKKTPKIFLNPGHGRYKNGVYDSGACGNGLTEAELTREVCREVEAILIGYAEVTVFDYEKDLYNYLDTQDFKWSEYDYFLSVHFDAGGGNGTTVYRAKNREANATEEALASKVAAAGGFKNNGVKEHPSNLAVLSASDKAQNGGTVSSLLEVCFIDNASDVSKYNDNKSEIAKAIANALIDTLSLTYASSGSWVANWKRAELPNSARALRNKTYERYFKITAACTLNYQISRGENASTHETRLRVWKNDFLIIALGSYYGPVGTFVKIKFDNGKEIVCIKGDEKDDRETNTEYPAHSYHTDGPGVVESNAISCNLLEVQADVSSSDWQEGFSAALNEYAGCDIYSAEIAEIYTSDTEPVWRGGGIDSANFENTNEKLPIHSTIFNMPDVYPDDEISVYAELRNITPTVSSVSWTNTKKELSTEISFSIAKSDTRYQNMYLPPKGEIIRLFTRKGETVTEVFRGIVISDDTGDKHVNSYTAADIGWYLNKCADTYQFKGISAYDAVVKICGDLSIPIAYINPVSFEGCYVTEIYSEKAISEVLWDILENKVGGNWNFDFVPSGIRFYKVGAFGAQPLFRMSDNTKFLDSVSHRGDEKISSSIEDMKTAVKIVSDTAVTAVARNNESIGKFGFLQEIIKNDDESADANSLAQAKLFELNRQKVTRSFTFWTEITDYTRAGEAITVDDAEYEITSSQHTIEKGRHKVTIELERIELK